ncbi:MAG: dTMP kinase, partial [Alphaproteobacteria bacterium]|nr:dTMP kinase [Alphaproteobacteria bacterium]
MTGRLITFEGGDGAGKSTQIARLADYLAGFGITVLCTREPGGTAEAEAIRALLVSGEADWEPLTEAMLHYAARREHVEKRIRPALAAGEWVISDRFYDSTVAYQCYGQG